LEDLLYFCRFLHYAAVLQLFGIAVFQAAIAPPSLSRSLEAVLQRTAVVCAATMLATALLWLALMAGSMGEGWPDFWNIGTIASVLTDTEFGHVWQVRLTLCLLLVVALFLRRRVWGLIVVLSALALGSLGFIGHAEMEEGLAAWLDQASQFLHLISAGFWLGSLLPLLVCLRPHGNAADQEAIATTLRRFSGYGHFAVAIILATGVANAWFVLGTLHLDPAVPYQALLIAKLLLVGVLVGLALANRYIFMPWIGDGAGLRALRVGTIAEMVVGAGVIGLVSVLGALSPT
jgi:putative copper resistance protein D